MHARHASELLLGTWRQVEKTRAPKVVAITTREWTRSIKTGRESTGPFGSTRPLRTSSLGRRSVRSKGVTERDSFCFDACEHRDRLVFEARGTQRDGPWYLSSHRVRRDEGGISQGPDAERLRLRVLWVRCLEVEVMQYLGGKAGEGKRIAKECFSRLTPGSMFVDMFCGALNVIRHVPSKSELAAGGLVDVTRVAVDACGPLITMWKAAISGWVPPKTVTHEEYNKIKENPDPHDPMTAFVLFGCSFGGKWAGGYAKDRPQQRYAECASNSVVKKAKDCAGVILEHNTFQNKHPGCWPIGTVMYCDPPYSGTTGYKAIAPFDSGAFWHWASEHARRGVHVYVSESGSLEGPAGWRMVLEQTASQGGRLTKGHAPRVDRLFYRGPKIT